jgi:YVTN family beta-propeller protein
MAFDQITQQPRRFLPSLTWGILLAVVASASSGTPATDPPWWLSPTALVAPSDGKVLYLACATAGQVALFDPMSGRITRSLYMPAPPTGLAVSADGQRLYVTCAALSSQILILDPAAGKIIATRHAGHTAMAPVLSRDGRTLYVCNRFDNDVSVLDLKSRGETRRIPVRREPVAADLTRDGKYLLVANHLPAGRADTNFLAAVISVIDLAAGRVTKEIQLPNGSGSVHDIRASPDGAYALVTHLIARFNRLPTRATGGWMHGNAMTIIDTPTMQVRKTILLDDAYSGAANPWALAWSQDGKTVLVTHAGTHEVSSIDVPGLLAQLSLPPPPDPVNGTDPNSASPSQAGHEDYFPFFTGPRLRIKLPDTDLGPRAVIISGHIAYVANYFSDTLTRIDLSATRPKPESIPLGPKHEMRAIRKGELYFHDARLCYDGWQSCSSCHPGDARVDGFNWDLLNDGIGNPKNTKSLLLVHRTPPSMWLGVRETAEAAVRAGIEHILFTQQPEEVACAIDEYLKSLQPVPSPWLQNGDLSPAARRGKEVFNSSGCAQCHPPPLFTDLHSHDVGTRASFDKPTDKFDTPTLIELWRTAPYLHDGSAPTVKDVVTTRNPHNEHGETSHLSKQELDELCTYLLSL